MVVAVDRLAHAFPLARAARSHKDLAASGPVAVEVASRRQATVGGRDRLVQVHREVAVHEFQRLGPDRFQTSVGYRSVGLTRCGRRRGAR